MYNEFADQIKLLKELESKKEHADKIIQDADAVMNSLAEVADDDTVEVRLLKPTMIFL